MVTKTKVHYFVSSHAALCHTGIFNLCANLLALSVQALLYTATINFVNGMRSVFLSSKSFLSAVNSKLNLLRVAQVVNVILSKPSVFISFYKPSRPNKSFKGMPTSATFATQILCCTWVRCTHFVCYAHPLTQR